MEFRVCLVDCSYFIPLSVAQERFLQVELLQKPQDSSLMSNTFLARTAHTTSEHANGLYICLYSVEKVLIYGSLRFREFHHFTMTDSRRAFCRAILCLLQAFSVRHLPN